MHYADNPYTTHKHKKRDCYVYNPLVVELLISAGAQLNNANLEMALLTNNEDAIMQLLKGTSVYKSNIYAKYFERFVSLFEMAPINKIDEANVFALKQLQKDTENIFENSNLILPMTKYLFIHQLTFFMDKYPNMWSINDQQKIVSLLNIDYDRNVLPIVSFDNDSRDYRDGNSTHNKLINKLEIKISKYREIIHRLQTSIFSLTIEKNLIKNSLYDAHRKFEIDALIEECETNNTHCTKEMKELETISHRR